MRSKQLMFGISLCCLYRACLSGYCLQVGLALWTCLYSQTICQHVSVSATIIIRVHKTTDQKHRYRRCLSFHTYTHRYISPPPSTQNCLCHTSHVRTGVVDCTAGTGGSVRGCIRLRKPIKCSEILSALFLQKLSLRLVFLYVVVLPAIKSCAFLAWL